MKIIGKIHDYYDGCGYSSDASTGVYDRVTKTVPVVWNTRNSGILSHEYDYIMCTNLIGFCGKLYPYIVYKWNDYKKDKSGIEYFYSYDAYKEVRDAVKDKRDMHSWINSTPFIGWKKEDYAKMWFDCDFDSFNAEAYCDKRKKYVKPKDIFLEHRVPYFFLGRDVEIGRQWRNKNNPELILNPCLKDYKFYRMVDSYTAYQDIEFFINNEIVRPDDPFIAPVDDKTKAESHGFNKYSFRQDKGVKKRKSKKKRRSHE